jgi:hypothetical protein
LWTWVSLLQDFICRGERTKKLQKVHGNGYIANKHYERGFGK